jgi:hypothetical protein
VSCRALFVHQQLRQYSVQIKAVHISSLLDHVIRNIFEVLAAGLVLLVEPSCNVTAHGDAQEGK